MKNNSTGLFLIYAIVLIMILSSAFSRKIKKSLKIDDEARIKKEAEKDLKMSRYFVRGLIRSLDFNQLLANKCAREANSESLSKVVQLGYNISTGKNKFSDLEQMKDLICSEMKLIPEKLQIKAVSKKVKDFIYNHMN